MDFIYTIDANADEPIMTLDEQIGKGEEGERYIDEGQFCKELLLLDNAGKKVINIWINSPGGSVIGGMQIFNTILKIKAKVDTHNVGMAASIAAPIFLAGRNRYMMDNAVLMVHPVSGGDEESRKVFENCVNNMISSRSFLTPERVQGMMNATTWLDAHQCESMGLCTKETSNEFNKKRAVPDLSNVSTAHKVYREIVNSALNEIKKPKNMDYKSINNKLNLNEDANTSSVIKAIEAIENKATEAESKVSKMKTELDEAENKFNELKSNYDKIVAENNAAKASIEAEKAVLLENKVKELVDGAVKVGKIENKAETVDLWKNMAKTNFDSAKAMIEAIPLNKKAPSMPVVEGDNEKALTSVIARTMAETRNSLKL